MEGRSGYSGNQCVCSNCRASSASPSSGVAELQSSKLRDELFDINKRIEYPVNTSELYRTANLPERFEYSHVFHGYGLQRKNVHPAYRSSSSDYGWLPPNAHTVPHRYFPRSNEFSTLMAQCGMYRNHSLNTESDKSLV